MRRVISVFLPTWPTDRLRKVHGLAALPPERPLALIGRYGNQRTITACDLLARACGVRIGMTVARAQLMAPEAVLKDAEPEADTDGLNKLALWALQRFSPMVAADAPDGLVIDSSGADHLYGGEEDMLRAIVDSLAAFGVNARAVVADSWGAAHALARFRNSLTLVVPPGESSKAMLDLPVGALRLPTLTVDGLRKMGFDRIGELAAQPRAPLVRRFGPELTRRLDQAFGRMNEPIEPVKAPDQVEAQKGFAEPISHPDTIARYTGALVHKLCDALEERSLGVRRLDLLFRLVDNSTQAIRVATAQPVRDPKRLTRLLSDQIETVDPGFGIELMTLMATQAEPLSPRQRISALAEEPDCDVSELIDTLANRIGADRIYRYAPVDSDVPERAYQRVSATAPDFEETWPSHWPRPTRLLPRPERIDALGLLPDHAPITFTWRGVRRRVRAADGPERVFGEWWWRNREVEAVRDYFQVEDEDGGRFWIFRAGDGENAETGSHHWFMHGIFA